MNLKITQFFSFLWTRKQKVRFAMFQSLYIGIGFTLQLITVEISKNNFRSFYTCLPDLKLTIFVFTPIFTYICYSLRDLVPYVQFKIRKKTYGGVLLLPALLHYLLQPATLIMFFFRCNSKDRFYLISLQII